jgi:hypothetical protein
LLLNLKIVAPGAHFEGSVSRTGCVRLEVKGVIQMESKIAYEKRMARAKAEVDHLLKPRPVPRFVVSEDAKSQEFNRRELQLHRDLAEANELLAAVWDREKRGRPAADAVSFRVAHYLFKVGLLDGRLAKWRSMELVRPPVVLKAKKFG